MGETGRPGRNPRQGVTAKAMKTKPVKKETRPEREEARAKSEHWRRERDSNPR
jgi:hypothetical protein